MVISGGVDIDPQEAEAVLVGHPKVADVAVIGVPSEDLGEEVKAVGPSRREAACRPLTARCGIAVRERTDRPGPRAYGRP